MTTTIPHPGGNPYPIEREVGRALQGLGWRSAVMFAEQGDAIRIARFDQSYFGRDALVLTEGMQLVISGGQLTVEPIPGVS